MKSGWILGLVGWVGVSQAAPKQIAFFETHIRPAFSEHCYECHNSLTERKGGLALDWKEPLLAGGDAGPIVVPGAPGTSRLLAVLRHTDPHVKMPKGSPRLDDAVIEHFAQWIREGAVDPRDRAPTADEFAKETRWEPIRERRAKWWSFQPVKPGEPPAEKGLAHPVDRFVRARLTQEGLAPSPRADRPTQLRRLRFVLTGLPPTPEEVAAFVSDSSEDAWLKQVDRLLATPAYAERWARHWMDWMRYADSHGSEGDARIPYVHRYRDYLIEALEKDVPYEQMVREHIAGDLLPDPRIDADAQVNRSAMGLGHYRLVPHGYAPTDALDEQVNFTENQIDVITKAFQGITVACARCHNHKFDAISQKDYYALYGIMVSARPAVVTVDTPEKHREDLARLRTLQSEIQQGLAEKWLSEVEQLPERLQAKVPRDADRKGPDALAPWSAMQKKAGDDWGSTWRGLIDRAENERAAQAAWDAGQGQTRWHLGSAQAGEWFRHGAGVEEGWQQAGFFRVARDGEQLVQGIYPAGVYGNGLSDSLSAVLHSPRFTVAGDQIRIRAVGEGEARARLVVRNYPRQVGPIYRATTLKSDRLAWSSWSTKFWIGDEAHIEFATKADVPVEIAADRDSWWGVTEIAFAASGGKPRPAALWAEQCGAVLHASDDAPDSPAALAVRYRDAAKRAVQAWVAGEATDEQAALLDALVRRGLLSNDSDTLPEIAARVASYRAVARGIAAPVRVPGVLDGSPMDQPLFVRGSHKSPTDPVPRRYLEVLGEDPYRLSHHDSGRLQLANDLVRSDNPFTARVIANRLWHYVFGRGIVATPDNLGKLGELPSHPELLDWLAHRFVEDGWSMKRHLRLLVTSETFRQSSVPSPLAREKDPTNQWLSHMALRRLSSDAIRDAVLAVSGKLDRARGGASAPENGTRRSLYVSAMRNNLPAFLEAFDAPVPLSTQGRRNSTNVPGQSLALLNDPVIRSRAREWADRIQRDRSLADDAARVRRMMQEAFAGEPTEAEVMACVQWMKGAASDVSGEYAEGDRLKAELATERQALEDLLRPVRSQLLAEKKADAKGVASGPAPVAYWPFDGDGRDHVGALHAKLEGSARIADGALILDGKGYAVTPKLSQAVGARSMAVRVQLSTLDQQGGGVMTLQTADGNVFDAIVYAERKPREWLAGSNHFRRTNDFGGAPDDQADRDPVHLVFVWEADGRIRAYRNGVLYGKPTRKSGLISYDAHTSVLSFGVRHLPAGGNRQLRGRVLDAALFDRALTPGEVGALATQHGFHFVSEQDLVAALSPEQRVRKEALAKKVEGLERAVLAWEKKVGKNAPPPAPPLAELAHVLFNFKEFVYLR